MHYTHVTGTQTQTEIHMQMLPRGQRPGSPVYVSLIVCAALTGPSAQPEAGNQCSLPSSRSLGAGWGSDRSLSSRLCPTVTLPGCGTPAQMPRLSSSDRHSPTEWWAFSLWTLRTLGAPPAWNFVQESTGFARQGRGREPAEQKGGHMGCGRLGPQTLPWSLALCWVWGAPRALPDIPS